MNVFSIRPEHGPSVVARFDIEVSPHLRLFNLVLRKTPDGRYRTYAQNVAGKHVATFHPDLAIKITDAAKAALGGCAANERSKH